MLRYGRYPFLKLIWPPDYLEPKARTGHSLMLRRYAPWLSDLFPVAPTRGNLHIIAQSVGACAFLCSFCRLFTKSQSYLLSSWNLILSPSFTSLVFCRFVYLPCLPGDSTPQTSFLHCHFPLPPLSLATVVLSIIHFSLCWLLF